MDPRKPYHPIGENPDPGEDETPPDSLPPDSLPPLPRSDDDDPAHDDSAAPDD